MPMVYSKNGFLSAIEGWLMRIGLTGALMVCAFLAGVASSWTTVKSQQQERNDLLGRAAFANMQIELACAALSVDEGRFDDARVRAGNFFRELRKRYDTDDSLQRSEVRDRVRHVLARRDEVMFLLNSNDPSAAGILRNGFFKLQDIAPPHATENSGGG